MHRQNATEQRHNYLHIIQVRSKTHRKAIFQEHDNEKPIDVLYNELKHGWGTARSTQEIISINLEGKI